MTAQTSTQDTPTSQGTTKWVIDPAHSSVTFGVRHMMVSTVRGEFQKVSGSVTYDPSRPEATVIEASVEAASIATRDAQRDAHLKSADFFDAEKYPTLDFRSKSLARGKGGHLELVGDLTIHGTTRSVTLEVEGPSPEFKNPWGQTVIGASAKTTIKRSEFGITWNNVIEAGGLLVGDEVHIQLDIQLRKEG